jgi:hypothetical protein
MNNNVIFNASMKSMLCKMATECSTGDKEEEKLVPRLLRDARSTERDERLTPNPYQTGI